MQVWALIVDCFREAIDRKLFWVLIAISVVIACGMACVGFSDDGVSLLFGLKTVDTDGFGPSNPDARGRVANLLVHYIGDLYIGWIAIILAVVATAGIFPAMLESGTIDVVLSKPISRSKLFLGKYLGSMVFVAVQAAVFVVLTFLVVGWRWQQWFPAYLWSIPLIVLLFSYIYAFCALFGIMTRSAMTALLLSIAAWFVIWIPQTAYEILVGFPTDQELAELSASEGSVADTDTFSIDEKWVQGAELVRTIIPKTQDIPLIAGKLIHADTPSELIMGDNPPPEMNMEGAIRAEKKLAEVDIVRSIGTSLLFEALIVGLALWRFSRQDF